MTHITIPREVVRLDLLNGELTAQLTKDENIEQYHTTQAAPAVREPYDKTEMNAFVQNLYDEKMREGKHGHAETIFHVVHKAIERVHGIGTQEQK